MPMFADKATFETLMKAAEAEIERQRDLACGYVSFYIKDRLQELEELFPGHAFAYSHGVYGLGVSIDPPLSGRKDLDDLEGDLSVIAKAHILSPREERLCVIYADLSALADMIEDDFKRNPGRITTDSDLSDAEVPA